MGPRKLTVEGVCSGSRTDGVNKCRKTMTSLEVHRNYFKLFQIMFKLKLLQGGLSIYTWYNDSWVSCFRWTIDMFQSSFGLRNRYWCSGGRLASLHFWYSLFLTCWVLFYGFSVNFIFVIFFKQQDTRSPSTLKVSKLFSVHRYF